MTPEDRFERRHDPGLQAKVAFLSRPDSYPERPERVEALETHMSWVFLTDRHAYKLKKPVRHPFLDFTTLAARRANCDTEVRLNRRLAREVYLGIVALALDAEGRLQLGGPGVPVEWLVKMVRLPRTRLLDHRMSRGAIDLAELDPAAQLLAKFYAEAPSQQLAPQLYRERFASDVTANERALLDARFAMPSDRVQRTVAAQRDFIAFQGELLEERVRAARIVEGHGDLRPEHIFLGPPPAIIDCLEFNPDLRSVDPADELAFLTMECELLGQGSIGRRFLEVYCGVTGDAPAKPLFDFYQCFRACVRSKLALWHLPDPNVEEPERWRSVALRYLDLAEGYARGLHGPAAPSVG